MSRMYDALRRSLTDEPRAPAIGVESRPNLHVAARQRQASRPTTPTGDVYQNILRKALTSAKGNRPRVILVLSSVRREGASTVARGIAGSWGQSGASRILLIDANLHSPSQHVAFGVPRDDGLSDVLAEKIPFDEAVISAREPGLSLLTSGNAFSGPTQFFDTRTAHAFFSSLRSSFDLVIVDGPPATTHSEATSLAGLADGVILVIAAERTRREIAREAAELLEGCGSRVLGTVLNERRYHIPDWLYRRL